MALQMKGECVRCEALLPIDSAEARICSYECTFCASCSREMESTCPNCGGELVLRPRRTKRE